MQEIELIRQEYLRAMGVDLWFRRTELPGVDDYSWPELEERPKQPLAPIEAREEAKSAPAKQRSRNIEVPESAPSPAENQNVELPAEVTLHFRLNIWSQEQLLILDLRPLRPQPQLEQSMDRLLGNLLQAWLGNASINGQSYTWPLFENPGIVQGPSAAAEYLGNKVGSIQAQQTIRRVLLLGEMDALLLDKLLQKSNMSQQQVLSLPSLAQMLSISQLKRQAWLDLIKFWQL